LPQNISIKKAATISAMGKYSKVIITLFINAILARLLTPKDYGIVAIVTVFSTFFSTFSDMGFGTAIVQRKDLDQDDIDNIFSFSAYLAFILAIIFMLLSYQIAKFYNNQVYIKLGHLLSIALFFNTLNMIPKGVLNREKKFVLIAVRTISVYSFVAVIAIILAYKNFSYYSLVIQAILNSIFTFVWNYSSVHPKFKFRFSFNSIKKVLNYSSYQFAFNVMNYFSRNLDNLLIGKFMGDVKLGYYNKAYSLMLYPVNNLTGVISPILHPILSDYQTQKDIIYRKYLKIVKFLGCIGIFVFSVCFLGSREIVNILYGPNWDKSIICFHILSIAIIPQMLNSVAGSIFQSLGDTKLLFRNGAINTSITILAILYGTFIGNTIVYVATCVAFAYIFHFVCTSFMLIKLGFNYKLRSFLKNLSKEFGMLIAMLIGVFVYPFNINNILLSFFIKGVYLTILYAILLIVTKEYKIFSFFKRK
jgi:PST family polysaccharide transporter